MAAARPTLSATGCSHCRSVVLNLFAGSALRSTSVVRSSLPSTRAQTQTQTQTNLPIRRFSSFQKLSNSNSEAEHGVKNDGHGDKLTASDSNSADVPWYLQVEPPTHVAPMEPPPLPQIPTDAPPFIANLVEYASEEMGLDALSLLDLRKLDPPPALGPNLFMLFGNARSERHLNVSAGRLVRWLRAKHRIHADADGLLGPNERKTKLRRKARRAKLLGTMGTDEGDDGIRTGWVCVNLGTVDRGGPESEVVAEDGRVSGFGISQAGSTVVVQIMTESRRAEMGLETLWTRALNRSISPPLEPGSKPEDKIPVDEPNNGNNPHPVQGGITADFHRPSKSPSPDRMSLAGAKSDRKMHPVEKAMLANLHRPSSLPQGRKGPSSGANQFRFYSTQQLSRPSYQGVDPLSTSSPIELARVLAHDAHQKQRLLELLRTQLDGMNIEAAQEALGGRSTPFIELMELAMQTLPPTRTWEYRLAFQHKAVVSGFASDHPSLNVILLSEELSAYGIQATREQYLQLISCMLGSLSGVAKDDVHRPSKVLAGVLAIMNTMHQRDQSIMADDTIVTIIEGVSSRHQHFGSEFGEIIGSLELLLSQPNLPYMGEKLLMRLMTAHAHRNDWDRVWEAWRTPPRHLRPRSADLYCHMFDLAAATHSAIVCARVIRRCVPEMRSEYPPVRSIGRLRESGLRLIDIVDRHAQKDAKLPEDSPGVMSQVVNKEFAKVARFLMGP